MLFGICSVEMEKTDSEQFSPDFQNYRNSTRNDKRSKVSKSRDSTEHMSADDDDDDQAMPQVPVERPSDILGNSLSGMSKAEISEHHELCMRLAAENKITLKNSFGLHLIAIMNQMVKECPDLQLASLSLAASSKIYCGRVEALYKDTFQFHSNLQAMVSTGKKSKKDDIQNDDNDEEEANEKRRSRHNKSKSYLTSHESVSLDSQRSGYKMPHSNFIVINSAFSASRSAKKLVSLPFECDSNKLGFSSSACFRPRQPINAVLLDAHKKLTGILEKIKTSNLKSCRFEDMDSSTNVLFQPDKSFSPKQNFEAPLYDDYSVFSPIREENNEMDVMIDRFSILDITVDAFTQDIFGAVTSGNTVDAQRLPPNSALKTVLQSAKKVKSTVKQKKEIKPKEPFLSGELNIKKSHFKKDRKTPMQAAFSEWSSSQTSVFFSNDEFNNLSNNSNIESTDNPNKEPQGIQLPFRYASDNETRLNLQTCFLKCTEIWKRHHLRKSHLKVRPSSLGMMLGARSSDPSSVDLVQSFRELSLRESFGGNADDSDVNPLPIEEVGFSPNDIHSSSPALQDRGDSDPFGEEYVSEILEPSTLESDVKSMMVAPPELVRPINVRFEAVPNSINMEKGKDLLWSVISAHLSENESTLLSKVHEELEIKMKSTRNTHKQSLFEGISLQFTFVILLILANEKILLLENIPNSVDLVIKRDISEIDPSEEF